MFELDHFMWVTNDLSRGMDEIEERLGVRPVEGGSHEGVGTRNALLGFGEKRYLEILAPDPGQDISGTMGELLQGLPSGGLVAWAVRAKKLENVSETLLTAFSDWTRRDPVDMSRKRPDGLQVGWRLLLPGLSHLGVPFFIDWLDAPHPTEDLSDACEFLDLTVISPYSDNLSQLSLDEMQGVKIKSGDDLAMDLHLRVPTGEITLGTVDPMPERVRI